ncbi:MAG: 30S ribosomal protein S12 methylthiotransferase RimO [Dehalococcoidia bacterium]|jgi:ribosomal protein S12 methylthiotransferase
MSYYLLTLGCPKNVADSTKLDRMLREAGAASETATRADLLIVNTCSFVDEAKEESINAVLKLATRKRRGQELVVIGCLPELYHKELLAEVPEIDYVFGVESWTKVAELANRACRARVAEKREAGPSAYLKIADGCNARCAFCLIPRIKGRLHSEPVEPLVEEAKRLAAEGAKELVLVAQDSTAYGRDVGMKDGLASLLRRLALEMPSSWLRVMYAYPCHVSPRLVRTMAETPQVCHYLDIPLQHSSPAILQRMRRPHDLVQTVGTLERLRDAMPDIALRTTFMVGFPGETEQDFAELLAFVRETRYDHVGAFMFSPQEGTAAARIPHQVPERVKRRRYRELMRVAQETALEANQRWLGKELTVLVESKSGRDSAGREMFGGRSYRDAPEVDGLVLCAGEALPGEMKRVRIVEALAYDLIGEPVEDSPSG